MNMVSPESRETVVSLKDRRLLPPVCRHIVLYYVWAHQAIKSPELKALLQLDERLSLEV